MDYKSFAAIMSYALERDLTHCPVASVINHMKSEYKTEDFNLAVEKQIMSLYHTDLNSYGRYSEMIKSVFHHYCKEFFYPGV